MTYNLITATEDFLTRERIHGKNAIHYYPSEASVQYINSDGETVTEGTCLRKAYFRCVGVEGQPYTANTQFIFGLGKYTENFLVDTWKEMGVWVNNSVRWYDQEYNLSGELDAILRQPDTGINYGVEVKSFYGYFMESELFGTKTKTGAPKMNHLLQTLVYQYEFPQLDHFEMVYLGRDKARRITFRVELLSDVVENETTGEEELVHRPTLQGTAMMDFTMEDVLARYTALDLAVKDRLAPDRDYELKYSKEKVEKIRAAGELSTLKYNKYLKCKSPTNADWPGDWQCIAEGTYISTLSGWKKIEEVNANDKVMTTKGFHNVSKVWRTKKNADTVLVKPYLLNDYQATSDHEILIATSPFYHEKASSDYKSWQDRVSNTMCFKKIKDIDLSKRNYVVYNIDMTTNSTDLNEEQLILLGNFITEGNYHKNEDGNIYKCGFTFGLHEQKHAERIGQLALKYGATSYKTKIYEDNRHDKTWKSIQLKVYGVKFVREFLQKYIQDEYSYNKSFPEDITRMHPKLQETLLNAMVKQDGSIIYMRDSKCWNYSTTSKKLALQVQQMMLRNNRIASIVKQKGGQICFEKSVRKDSYHIRWFPEAKHNYGFIKNNKLFARLAGIETGIISNVWDISVNGQHEFLTQGGIVHNCRYCNYEGICWDQAGNAKTVASTASDEMNDIIVD